MDPSERLRQILPLLRPRSAEPTWYSTTLLLVVIGALVGLVAFYFIRRNLQRRRLESGFRRLAADAGLEAEQTNLLWQIAERQRLKQPLALLQSSGIFDRQVGLYADALAADDLDEPRLAALALIRRYLGFDRPPEDGPLSSSRQLPEGQTLHLTFADDAESDQAWVLIERHEGALVVAPLLEEDIPPSKLRPDLRLQVHFWHEEGVQYLFDTHVLRAPGRTGHLYLAHAAQMAHLQQRHFYRLQVDFPLRVFLMPDGPLTDEAGATVDLADATPLDCRAADVSGGGISLIASGRLPLGSRLLIDPDFVGEFPLAGLHCTLVRQLIAPQGTRLQCRFVGLTDQRESDLVRVVQQHQVARREA